MTDIFSSCEVLMDIRRLILSCSRFGSLFSIATFCTAMTFGQGASDDSGRPLKLEYTGALFGYYRIEPNTGFVGGLTKSLPAVKEFIDDRENDRKIGQPLLLGMGDNFGPEFGAAIQFDRSDGPADCRMPLRPHPSNRPDPGERPQLLYKMGNWFAPLAHCDNVANFLMKAGYRALVPGKEDFLNSAQWLQEIAIKLGEESREKGYNPNAENKLNLLAANLRVGAKGSSGAKPSPCPLLFSADARPSSEEGRNVVPTGFKQGADPLKPFEKTRCVASEGESIPETMDWVERLDLTLQMVNNNYPIAQEIQKSAKRSVEVQRQVLMNQMSLTLAALGPEIVASKDAVNNGYLQALQAMTKEEGYRIEGEQLLLKQDPKHPLDAAIGSLEVVAKTPAAKELGLTADITYVLASLRRAFVGLQENDFLDDDAVRRAARDLLLRRFAAEEEGKGYVVAEIEGSRVLLLGVVGTETMAAVSPSNLKLGAANVIVLDPRRTAEILVRAANLVARDGGKSKLIGKTILMAQMPRTEAEELGAHLLADFQRDRVAIGGAYPVDLILSEAQEEHASHWLDSRYQGDEGIPVLTPHPAFDRAKHPDEVTQIGQTTQAQVPWSPLVNPVSDATIEVTGSERHLSNQPRLNRMKTDHAPKTTVGLLETALNNIGVKSDAKAIDFVLHELQLTSGADVVLLERRDLYFGELPFEYSDYDDTCPKSLPYADRCVLHVALDRLLWKGDFSERVMVTGKDLKDALKAAGDQVVAQRSLAARDTTNEWLVTFGVVTSDPTHLTRLESSGERFGVPYSEECGTGKGQTGAQYCVNGSTIADDSGYWVATSDHIANDTAIYTMFEPKMKNYHEQKHDLFITDELARNVLKHAHAVKTSVQELDPREGRMLEPLQQFQQDRSLLHLDYAKLVAGFSIRHPNGGNAAAAGFQGVTETRASQAGQQELDLEYANRLSRDSYTGDNGLSFAVGVQSDAEYDRAAQGNLTNKPINASYAVNNLSAGVFIQKRIPFWTDSKTTGGNWASRELPRSLFVLYPYQYQRQLIGNPVFLNFTTGNRELTVHPRVVTGHAYKAGGRRELTNGRIWSFDRGSYGELGFEYVVQNEVLRSLTLTTVSTASSKTCSVAQKQTLSQCFNGFTIDQTTTVVHPFDVVNQTTTGMYWDIHLQRSLPKAGDSANAKENITIDTKGDFFGQRASSLATQTRYAFPVTAAINFPVLRNFSLSPSYSAFLYENQVSEQNILVNTFSIAAKWYFDRDSGVPMRRMLLFKGPGSQDQTKTAKMK